MITPRLLGGRYEVGEVVGHGGMAEVARGYDTRLGRPVAIKLLRSDLARDANFLTRFRREAQAAGGLAHPAIVAIYDSGEELATDDDGTQVAWPYIVMEFVDGETLRERLNRDGAFAPAQAAQIVQGVLSALAYSHRMGIVHRDIKPANVMITTGGDIKVMDFGIARAVADTAATMTQTQAVIGTAQYLSPEQAQGLPVDARTDLYSTGCLLFELLTGRPPFVGDSPVSVAYQHVQEQPQAPSAFNADVPRAYDLVTLHALVKNRDDSYQTAVEFRNDLAAAREGRPLSAAAAGAVVGAAAAYGDTSTTLLPAPATAAAVDPLATGPQDVVEPEEEKRRGWAYVGLTLLAILVLIGVFFAARALFQQDEAAAQVAVPRVVGLQLEAAKTALAAKNLATASENVTNNTVPKGQVVEQDPPDGTMVNTGSTVTLQVSSGPGQAALPNVVGFSQDAAVTALKAAGFTNIATIKQVDDNSQQKGNVVATAPAANTVTAFTSPVTLSVATGKVPVPSVLTQHFSVAQATLQKAGLVADITEVDNDTQPEGTVLEQNPAAGQVVDVGSHVALKIARRPAVTTTATVTTTVTQPPTTPPPTTTATSAPAVPTTPGTTAPTP